MDTLEFLLEDKGYDSHSVRLSIWAATISQLEWPPWEMLCMRDVRQENVVLLLLHYVPLLLLPCLVLGGGLRLMIHILSRNYRMMPRGRLWKRGSNRLIQILGRRKRKRRDRNENRRIKKKCLEIQHNSLISQKASQLKNIISQVDKMIQWEKKWAKKLVKYVKRAAGKA